jgi:dolichyl-phosphate-mannose--protein O-mannosyl transferase
MDRNKINYKIIFEVSATLGLGMITTLFVIKNIYEMNGIPFIGNTAIIWFSVSFIIYGIETIIKSLFTKKSEELRKRVKGFSFWAVFIFSLILLLIPII